MPEALYSNLSNEDRLYALRLAQDEGRYRAYLLEKDIWMVASLSVLFDAPFANHLTFTCRSQRSGELSAASRKM